MFAGLKKCVPLQPQTKPAGNNLKSLNVFQCERGRLAQLVPEHLPYKQRVGGSNPSTPTTSYGFVAQLNRASDYGSEVLGV